MTHVVNVSLDNLPVSTDVLKQLYDLTLSLNLDQNKKTEMASIEPKDQQQNKCEESTGESTASIVSSKDDKNKHFIHWSRVHNAMIRALEAYHASERQVHKAFESFDSYIAFEYSIERPSAVERWKKTVAEYRSCFDAFKTQRMEYNRKEREEAEAEVARLELEAQEMQKNVDEARARLQKLKEPKSKVTRFKCWKCGLKDVAHYNRCPRKDEHHLWKLNQDGSYQRN